MTLAQVLSRLEALGSEKGRQQNIRHGASGPQFGVKMGDIRALAKEIKVNPPLAKELWESANLDARFLAVLLLKPKDVALSDLESMVKDTEYSHLADWVNTYLVKQHPDKEALRQRWMTSDHPSCSRTAWSLTAERIEKNPEGLDLSSLLDRIESELAGAHPFSQWTMNFALAAIGIHHPSHRERALEIGERLGVYRDYPTPKGCTSPFAPLWIAEMVRRQG